MAVTYSQNGTIVRQISPTDAVTTHRIDSEQGINVVDENGYIGAVVTDYFPHAENTYFNNFAIVVNNADFSQSGLGQVTFITPGTADIGGRTYRTVNIGGVEWLAENLDYKFSGCAIGSSGAPSTPAAWYYNNDETAYGIDGTRKCGLLYNWYAASLLNSSRATLCPGWHVPTNDEWSALVTAVGGSSTAGTKLKASNNSVTSNWPSGWKGTEGYEFFALPTGARTSSSSFTDVGTCGYFWTATTTTSSSYAYVYYVDTAAAVNTYSGSQGGAAKSRAHSLRLVRDAT